MKRRRLDPDDAPEQTAADFARAVRIPDGPEALSNFMRTEARKRRGLQKAPTKQIVTIRLDRDIVQTYRGTGRGWQGRMNADLARSAKRIRAARAASR